MGGFAAIVLEVTYMSVSGAGLMPIEKPSRVWESSTFLLSWITPLLTGGSVHLSSVHRYLRWTFNKSTSCVRLDKRAVLF